MDKERRRGPRPGAGQAQNRGAEKRFPPSKKENGRFSSRKGEDRKSGKAGSARDAALHALMDVAQNGAYASIALDRQLSGKPLSPEDRRLATNLFYLAAENRLRIEYALSGFLSTRPEPTVWDILHIAAAQILYMDRIPAHAAVDEAVKQVRAAGREGLTGMVNAVLRNLVRAKEAGETLLPDREEDPLRYISVRHSLAEPILRRLVSAYGLETAEAIAAYRPERREVSLRMNPLRTDAQAFAAVLDRACQEWRPGAIEGSYLCVPRGDLTGLSEYRDGQFSIQGESSMLAALALSPRPGMSMLDACAAPGGKSALLAERMMGTGRVYAWDIHPHRVELIKAMAARLRLDDLRPSVHDARKPMEALELSMDGVLVDAPCSGLGVIADKPDLRFRLTEQNFQELLPLQRDILSAAATHVKPGGLLVYSTCTILPEENEAQVKAFLSGHPEFVPEADASYLPEGLRPLLREGMLQLLQHQDGLEGFFIARMRRRRS